MYKDTPITEAQVKYLDKLYEQFSVSDDSRERAENFIRAGNYFYPRFAEIDRKVTDSNKAGTIYTLHITYKKKEGGVSLGDIEAANNLGYGKKVAFYDYDTIIVRYDHDSSD